MIKPVEIVIAGVQKAATSSLQVYLGQHPEIITHDEREFSFFVQDDEFNKGYSTIFPEYFPEESSAKKILIKNVGIIYWEDAMQRLQQHNPDVKIIIVLRNPVARAYSAYWYARQRSKENAITFEDALHSSEKKVFDKESKAVAAYLERGNYVSQLKNLYKYFKPEQVKIILFEDLKEHTERELKNLFEFCAVSGEYQPVLEKKLKSSSQPRSEWLASITNQQTALKSKIRKLLPAYLRHGVRKKLNELNKKEFIPPPINSETKRKLVEHFRPMVDELSIMIGRDLSFWNK
ncbi:MAG: sulfotransferase domain-containing protein [Bacteroidia bacterium]